MLTAIAQKLQTDRPVRASRAGSWARSWHSWLDTRRGPTRRRNLWTPEPADTPARPRGLSERRERISKNEKDSERHPGVSLALHIACKQPMCLRVCVYLGSSSAAPRAESATLGQRSDRRHRSIDQTVHSMAP